MIAAYALGVPLPAARKLGTSVNFSDWFTAHSRQPDDCRPRKRHDGDEGKAVGCAPPTALLFEQAQYKISKIKLAISTMAITPATESTNAWVAAR